MIHMKTLHWYTFILLALSIWAQGLRVDIQNRRMEKLYLQGVPFTDKRMIRLNEILIRRKKSFLELEASYLRLRFSAMQALNG